MTFTAPLRPLLKARLGRRAIQAAVIPFQYGVFKPGERLRARAAWLGMAGEGTAREAYRMQPQPESTSPPLPASPAPMPVPALPLESRAGQAPPPGRPMPHGIPRWLERAELFLRVLLRMYIGIAICYAPWSRLFWDQNPLFTQFPSLSAIAANGAVRGIVTGLGLLNLWIAFRDAVRNGAEK